MLEITVYKVKGSCPVFKKGDKIIVDDPEIVIEKTDALCISLHFNFFLPFCDYATFSWFEYLVWHRN